MSSLGRLLKELRGKESLRSVAKRSGISHNYLSLVEKGTDPRTGSPIKPSPDTLRSLSKAYNYSYAELMHAAGYVDYTDERGSENDNESSPINLIGDLMKLIERYDDEQIISMYNHQVDGRSIDVEQVKKILSYVRFVLNEKRSH